MSPGIGIALTLAFLLVIATSLIWVTERSITLAVRLVPPLEGLAGVIVLGIAAYCVWG
jgi:hypothetical protein